MSKKSIVIIIIIIIVIVAGYFYFTREKGPEYDFVIAEKGELIQEVSVTGRVEPAQSVDLAFEKSGRVSYVNVKVGNKVRAGQLLAGLVSGDISAQLLQAQANLEAEQAKLDEMKKGTRPEEIQAAETDVENAQRALTDAQTNLENVKDKADADLESDYNAALTAVQNAVVDAKNALITLTDIQFAHFTGSDANSMTLVDAKATAIESLLGAKAGGRLTAEALSELSGGAFGTVSGAVSNPTHENIDTALSETLDALQKVKDALDAIPITTDLSSTEKTSISTEKTSVSTEITSVSSKEQAITVQKATNSSNIATAEASVNTAKNTLAVTQDDLNLKRAGYTAEQIAAQQAKVKSAQANVSNYQAQLAKTIIRSPINGVVTKQDAKVGEIISANAILISLISEKNFEIEANVPEVDVAKLKVGNTAQVTLDAYGRDVVFNARVISVDPAETIIEGVATYKTKLQFIEEDGRIKSGMTANIDILTAQKENVIAIPSRAVIIKNGQKTVRILKDGEFEEVLVKTGIRGTYGNIEIVEGVNEGDRVITLMKE